MIRKCEERDVKEIKQLIDLLENRCFDEETFQRIYMKQLNDEQGVTIIMVTHDPLVASFSKRMIMIRDGSIEHEVVRGDMTQKEYLREINALQDAENEGLLSI